MANALAILMGAWASHDGEEETSTTGKPDAPADHAIAALERAGYPGVDGLRAALVARPTPADGTDPSAQKGTDDALVARQPHWDVIWAEIERLYYFSVRRLDPRVRRQQMRARVGLAAGLALVFMAVFLWRLWGRPVASASAVYSIHHPAANAIDGLMATEWLLPNATTGWLQINFSSPRTIHSVRLMNAHNIHFQDRASEKVRVIAYRGHQPVASAEGRFAAIVAGPSPLNLILRADSVTHIRIDVLSFFKSGGGLAEVEVH
jgi:hypothetical protein